MFGSFVGAVTITLCAPPVRCSRSCSARRNFPLASTTYSAPAAAQFTRAGSLSLDTAMGRPPTRSLRSLNAATGRPSAQSVRSSATSTDLPKRPNTESWVRRYRA